jgi:hypothetical protein
VFSDVFVLAGSSFLLGQDASITGIVSDAANAVMPGVTVKIRNTDTNIGRTIQTNHEGSYTVTNLPPGPYELTAEMQGFSTYRQTEIVLQVSQVLRANILLAVGSVTDSVNVTGEVAPLNTESGAIKGDVIVQQEINDLPLDGRDFSDLAFLVPGVAPMAQGGQGSGMISTAPDPTRRITTSMASMTETPRRRRAGSAEHERHAGIQDGGLRLFRGDGPHGRRSHEYGAAVRHE